MALTMDLRISAAVPPVIVNTAVVRNIRAGFAGVEFVTWKEKRARASAAFRHRYADRPGNRVEPLINRRESLIPGEFTPPPILYEQCHAEETQTNQVLHQAWINQNQARQDHQSAFERARLPQQPTG